MALLLNNIYSRFVLAGVVGAVTNLSIFFVLFDLFNLHYLISSVVAVAVSLVLSFFLQKFFTFKDRDKDNLSIQTFGFVSVAFFNLTANLFLVYVFVDWLGLIEFLAQALAAASLAVLSFVFYRFYVFIPSTMKKVILLNKIVFLEVVAGLALLLIFAVNGVYDTRIDAEIYLGQIKAFSTGSMFDSDPGVLLRLTKPFYGFVGSLLVNIVSPHQAILLINIGFLIVLVASFFWLLLLLEFNSRYATIGAVWLAFSYPLLKYGLALGTDISGWALATSSAAFALSAVKTGKDYRFVIASLIAALGLLSKETGVMGLLFGLCAIFLFVNEWGWKKTIKRFSLLVLPCFMLVSGFMFVIFGKAPHFLDWYSVNNDTYKVGYYTLKNMLLVEGSTFNLVWLLVIFAIFRSRKLWFKGIFYPIKFWMYMLIFLVVTAPVLLWPIFISRILFIQFLWVLPVALWGLMEIQKITYNRGKKKLFWLVAASPVVFSILLFVLSRGGSLYDVFSIS